MPLMSWMLRGCERITEVKKSSVGQMLAVASFPGSPSPFLTFSCAQILHAKNRRRGRAWYGNEAMLAAWLTTDFGQN